MRVCNVEAMLLKVDANFESLNEKCYPYTTFDITSLQSTHQ